MRALVFGTDSEPWDPPPDATGLMANLSVSPVALAEIPDARPLRPDWVVTKPLLTGICGSDSKQILMDFGDGDAESAMSGFCSFTQVMGHEVVAEVVELGPEAAGFEVGQRVVLNPWLSCVTRGIAPVCPACEAGDFSLCWSFTEGELTKGIHTGVSSDATGGYAELMPAHTSMLFGVPDSIGDESAILADPFAVSLHRSRATRHPLAGGSWCGARVARAVRDCDPARAVSRRRGRRRRPLRDPGRPRSPLRRPPRLPPRPGRRDGRGAGGLVRRGAAPDHGRPRRHPDVSPRPCRRRLRHHRQAGDLHGGGPGTQGPGTLVKSGVHAPGRWEWSPLYFKEISWVGSNAFGIEEVDGVRKHGIEHYLDLVADDRIDLTGMVTQRHCLPPSIDHGRGSKDTGIDAQPPMAAQFGYSTTSPSR